MDNESQAEARPGTALERLRLVSQALSDAARRTRVSSRSRRSYAGGGFQARRGAAAMRWGITLSFYLLVVIPVAAATVYDLFYESDQYVAFANFTVAGGEPIPMDGLAALTGIPAIAIVQDTQIVVNYIKSRSAVEKMQEVIDLRKLYSKPGIDKLSRFDPSKSIERLIAYWNKMVDVSIKMPAGTVELRVRAFSPDDAVLVSKSLLEVCEQLINAMNERQDRDAIGNAEDELHRTSLRLTQTQVALEQARNERGILDAGKAADALNKLVNDTRSSLLQMQQQYTLQLRFVSANAPQVESLKTRIDVTKRQLDDLQAKLTTTQTGGGDDTLASAMTRFSELELEHTTAEHMFASATASLEGARLVAEHKRMYLNTFVQPDRPEQSDYPQRGLQIAMMLGATLALWGICCGLAMAIRNNMA